MGKRHRSRAERAFSEDRIEKVLVAHDVRALRAVRTRRPDDPARAPFIIIGPHIYWVGH